MERLQSLQNHQMKPWLFRRKRKRFSLLEFFQKVEPGSQMMRLISLIICTTRNLQYGYEYGCRNSCQEAKIFLAGKSPTFPASCNTSRKFTETFLSITLQECASRKEKKTMRQIRENRSQRMIFEGGFVYGKWKKKV